MPPAAQAGLEGALRIYDEIDHPDHDKVRAKLGPADTPRRAGFAGRQYQERAVMPQ